MKIYLATSQAHRQENKSRFCKRGIAALLALLIAVIIAGCSSGSPSKQEGSNPPKQEGTASNPPEKEESDTIINVEAEKGELANGFIWEHNYSEILITGYEGASVDLIVPDQINGKPVTAIQDEAFKGFTALKSIVISGNVKTIGKEAFYNCTGLEKLTLKEGIEDIGIDAFSQCTALTSVTIPSTIKAVRESFSYCHALTSAVVSEGVENLNNAFHCCDALTSVTIPKGIKTMRSTFSHCDALTSVTIPEGVEDLDSAFYGCTSLTSITIPDSVKSAKNTFNGCSSLQSLEFPDETEIYDDHYYVDFSTLISLTRLKLPQEYTGDRLGTLPPNLIELTCSKEVEEKMLSDEYHYLLKELKVDSITINGKVHSIEH